MFTAPVPPAATSLRHLGIPQPFGDLLPSVFTQPRETLIDISKIRCKGPLSHIEFL